jgi:alanyl-tRNA synthetase
MALFGEKYGSSVRVVAVGADDDKKLAQAFSKEFCGGTHVARIGSIGNFKIIKEESISAGVRRITALTGQGLADYLEQRSNIIDELSVMLKVPAEDLADRIGNLIKENKKLTKELKSASKRSGSDVMAEAKKLLENCEKAGQTSIITGKVSTAPVEQVRAAIDMLKKKAKSAAIVLGLDDEGKAMLLASVTGDLIEKGLKATDIVKQIAPIIDGGGGGRDQMAQAGGKKPENIQDALTKAKDFIKQKLTSN